MSPPPNLSLRQLRGGVEVIFKKKETELLEGFCESSTSESIYYDGLQKNSKAAS